MSYFDMDNDEADLTPEQEAEEAFDEWYGEWLADLWTEEYLEALEEGACHIDRD